MNQPLSSNDIYQQLLDSDLKTELASASLLKQYKNYLFASQSKGIFMATSIPRILLCLSTIQKLHLEKLRLYYTLSPRKFHKCISAQHLEGLEMILYQVKVSLNEIKDLIPHVLPLHTPSVRLYFDDLVQFFSNKKTYFKTMTNLPGKPSMSPSVKPLFRT